MAKQTSALLDRTGSRWSFDAYVVSACFNSSGTHGAFALGSGEIQLFPVQRPSERTAWPLHKGSSLSFVRAPGDDGFLSGGDDGRLVYLAPDGDSTTLLIRSSRWVEHTVGHPHASAFACAVGNVVLYRPACFAGPISELRHPSSVGGLAFSHDGSFLAVSHYGGVTLWSLTSATPYPQLLKWRGSHLAVTCSPDNRYVITAMQEHDIHVFVVDTNEHLFMNAYDSKVHSLCWSARGDYLLTSGSNQVLCWPFNGVNGPQGQMPLTRNGSMGDCLVTCVAAHPQLDVVAEGFDHGLVWVSEFGEDRGALIRSPCGAPVTALAWSPDGRSLLMGTESGEAGFVRLLAD